MNRVAVAARSIRILRKTNANALFGRANKIPNLKTVVSSREQTIAVGCDDELLQMSFGLRLMDWLFLFGVPKGENASAVAAARGDYIRFTWMECDLVEDSIVFVLACASALTGLPVPQLHAAGTYESVYV